MTERRSEIMIKAHAFQRYVFWHYLPKIVNNVRVAEFPKSGGTWLCQMLSELFGMQFPRNQMLPVKSSIQHSHYIGPGHEKTIVLIRDGRDVMTSAYFHFLFYSKDKPLFLVNYWRELVEHSNYNDVRAVMPMFISKFNQNYKIGGRVTRWSEHVFSYKDDKNALLVRYEDLLNNAEKELIRITDWYNVEPAMSIESIVEKYNFKNQSNRNHGDSDNYSFLRKGISGDWKNYFTEEATGIFNKYNLDAMRYFGYE